MEDVFGLKVPRSHGMHSADFSAPEYVPAGHPSQYCAPATLNVPAAQVTHADSSEVPRLVLPYFPLGHLSHLLEFLAGENCPMGHPSHLNPSFVMEILYPALQMHSKSVPPEGESEYAGHPVHDPASGRLYVLGAHLVHALEPSSE